MSEQNNVKGAVREEASNNQADNSAVQVFPASGQITNGVQAVDVDDDFSAPEPLLKAQSLANTLDTAVKIPFIGLRVGLDFLIGLIPGIGDTIMLFASLRIVQLGYKLGVPPALRNIMIRNALIDYALGFIPILGDIVDLFFKANMRNVRIMEKWWVTENKDKIDALAKKQFARWEQEQDKNL